MSNKIPNLINVANPQRTLTITWQYDPLAKGLRVGSISDPPEVDLIEAMQATYLSMRKAIEMIANAQAMLVGGNKIPAAVLLNRMDVLHQLMVESVIGFTTVRNTSTQPTEQPKEEPPKEN
jgi:hypothetical protein